jgi:type I restriction enzyme, S subunit
MKSGGCKMKYKYRNSGVECLGTIPNHWAITKIKKEFRVIPSNVDKKSNDDENSVKLCNYVDVYYNEFINSEIDFMEATASEYEIKKFQLQIDDVLITKDSEDPHDIAVPALVTETKYKLLCGYHLSIIRSVNNKLLGEYLFWVLMDNAIVSQLHREATGITRWAIASRHIKNCFIPFPPINEQVAICLYLKKAWTNIERIIQLKFGKSKASKENNTKNQLQTLLSYRKSLIHECVTGKKQIAVMTETGKDIKPK